MYVDNWTEIIDSEPINTHRHKHKRNDNQPTSTELPIVHRIDGPLIVGVEDVGLVAAAGAALHGGVEAAGLLEAGLEAPRARRRPHAVATCSFTRAGVLRQQLLGPLAPRHAD